MKPFQVPSTLPGGDLLPHMSARLRTATIDALFEASGGFERARAFIEKSDEHYMEFFKIWAKGAARTTNVEHNVGDSVDALIKQLDKAERENMIDVTPQTVD